VEPADTSAAPSIVYLSGDVRSARIVSDTRIEFSYESNARAIAILDRPPSRVEIDGAETPLILAGPRSILLPRGQHLVSITAAASAK
jgi:hypothetical protein